MLAPDLFKRRFDDLMNIGRARLPALAPQWTDQNAHDPGIMLMELLAWTAEAQLYALSRMRRDERAAYAALLGIVSAGTTGAEGILWSDRLDPQSPAATFAKNVLIGEDVAINVVGIDTPTFRPARAVVWAPGRVVALTTRLPGGRTIDQTAANERSGPAFLPFGPRAGRRSVLAITFACRDEAGLFGATRGDTTGALWAIGVRAAPPLGAGDATGEPGAAVGGAPLVATYLAGSDRLPLPIVSDTTQGLLTTGALWLDVAAIPRPAPQFTLELEAPAGVPRPPRLLRVEPSVIPIRQGQPVRDELHAASGLPDWSFQLGLPGLRFAPGEEPIEVQVAEPSGLVAWVRRDSLANLGPDDRAYTLDADAGQVRFGNGVNGKVPPTEAQVLVSYAVCDGDQGNVARNRRWQVAELAGVFGVNPDPVTGGAAASGPLDQRRQARQRILDEHPLVTAADIAAAALELEVLEVARAWVGMPAGAAPRTGTVRLVAMRTRAGAVEPAQPPETPRWLEAVRRSLAPRIPLGTRLLVAAPRYVSFSIAVTMEAAPGRAPADVEQGARAELQRRLALVSSDGSAPVRQPGVPLTVRDLGAWLRTVEGLRRVTALRLTDARGVEQQEITVSPSGLPRWDATTSTIEATRP